MIKKILYHVLFIANIIALIMTIVQIIWVIKGHLELEYGDFARWKLYVTYLVFAFLIWNIVIWSKRDKKVGRFFALFFLPGVYTIYYYWIVVKNNWIDRKTE